MILWLSFVVDMGGVALQDAQKRKWVSILMAGVKLMVDIPNNRHVQKPNPQSILRIYDFIGSLRSVCSSTILPHFGPTVLYIPRAESVFLHPMPKLQECIEIHSSADVTLQHRNSLPDVLKHPLDKLKLDHDLLP